MCSSDFKPKQTRFAATVPLFIRADFSCWGMRSPSMWQYFTHSTTGWTLFTASPAGFVNFSNRISSLLFVTLALTSSSRIDKYAPWMLSWQSEPLTDRNEWVPHFPFSWQVWEMAAWGRRTRMSLMAVSALWCGCWMSTCDFKKGGQITFSRRCTF